MFSLLYVKKHLGNKHNFMFIRSSLCLAEDYGRPNMKAMLPQSLATVISRVWIYSWLYFERRDTTCLQS